MNIPKLKFGNSIFSRLVITFLVIIIPIYMLGIYIYNWGLQTVKNEISRSTIAQVSFYLEGLEKEIERIKILQYDCLNDENLNKLAMLWDIMDNYNRIECIRQLEQRLVTIKNSSSYIKNVSIHIQSIGKTISSNNGYEQINIENFQRLRIPQGLHGAQIIRFRGSLFLSTLHENNLFGSNHFYLIEIELNEDSLRQAIEQFNTYDGSVSFLVMNSDIILNQSDSNNFYQTEKIIDSLKSGNNKGIKLYKGINDRYYVVYSKSDYLNMMLLRYIPEEFVAEPLQNFYIWVWVFTSASVFIIVIFSFFAYKLLQKPLLKLIESFNEVENGDLQISINHNYNDEFRYLFERFNNMVKNLNMLIDQIYNQKILMQRAELKHLQSQINPHFLYNSFFMINTMARIGDENLIPFTKRLGEYFRFVTRSSSDNIPLLEEINHARVYTEIQRIRFSKRLEVRFSECPEILYNLKVPRLIIQPIIENAFEYGIEKKNSWGIISVSFEVNDSELNIIIEDSGNEMTDEKLEELRDSLEYCGEEIETTGTINIHRRIKLVYGGGGLKFSRSDLGGLKAVLNIKIPGGGEFV